MPAIMRILGWKAEGLRCPDHEVDCANSSGQPHEVTLIQMPNGTGKTTTLLLLRAALSGAAQDRTWERERIKELQKKESTSQTGLFEVRLLLNARRATIIMNFDFENGRIYYKTTWGPGQQDGFNPPADFRRFLNENFVNFFVFDGELAQNLLDKTHTDADSVVEALFQINSFDILKRKVEAYWQSKTEKVSATDQRGLSRRQNRLSDLRSRLASLNQEKKKLNEEKGSLLARLKRHQEAYDHEIKKEEARSHNLSKAETKVEQAKAKVREEALDVLDTMRDPHTLTPLFADAMFQLKIGLDRVKLPESAAREFFEELASEAECVCGRPIDEEIKQRIRERAKQYLGSDDVSLLNSMKTSIQEAVGTSTEDPERHLNEKIQQLETSVGQERDALNELDQLRFEAEQADPAVKKAKEEIDELQTKLSAVNSALEKFESKDQQQSDEQTFGIEIIEKRIEDAERKLAEITETIELKKKRDILTRIIEKAHEKARLGITTEIRNEANSRIAELMPHNSILIERIDRSLMLQGQEGGSVGETLSVAYAFLATLFHRSDHELPFIVDSPAGPIDLAVRPKIGELIPKLTGQFVAFTISSERASFVPRLKNASRNGIHCITLFRKGSSELEATARASGDYSETADGLSVRGEDFFNEFQLDTEETS